MEFAFFVPSVQLRLTSMGAPSQYARATGLPAIATPPDSAAGAAHADREPVRDPLAVMPVMFFDEGVGLGQGDRSKAQGRGFAAGLGI